MYVIHVCSFDIHCKNRRFLFQSCQLLHEKKAPHFTDFAKERKAIPVNLPLVVGNTSPTALAAPVALGMMLQEAARPPRQSWQGLFTSKRRNRNSDYSAALGYIIIFQQFKLFVTQWWCSTGVFIQMCFGMTDTCENGGVIEGSHLWHYNLVSI